MTRPADYQARRLNIRDEETGGFVHTINGTACAVPRMIMALVEQVWSLTQHCNVSFILSSGFYKHTIKRFASVVIGSGLGPLNSL